MEKRFQGKVAFITGGGSGIGAATAIMLAREGAAVGIADVNNAGGYETVARIEQSGGRGFYIHTDVTQPEQITQAVETTVRRYGRLDYACNSAGIGGQSAFTAEASVENWDHVMAVNLHGVFAAMQAEIHHMQAKGGAIVNIGSGAAYIGLAHSPAYTASKHAVIGLTKAAAAQYAEAGIRINAVCPGTTRTPLLPSTATREVFYEFAVPLKRVAEPQELAEAILWLFTEDAINGYSLIVDGGALAGPRSMSFSGQQIAELIRKLGAAALKDRFGRKQRKAAR